jgi:hypothetical protein
LKKAIKMKTQHHKTLRVAAALALTGMQSGQAFASPLESNNATADVTVQLIQPISIQKVSDLNFGTLMTGGFANISLSVSGNLQADDRAMPSVGSQPQAAQFEVSGEPFLNYSLNSDSLDVSLTNENNDSLLVNLIIRADSNDEFSGTLDAFGEDTIRVGGYFNMNEQARGTYTAPGGISVTVNYD